MRTAAILITHFFLAGSILAGNGGSAYSAFGIGDLRYFPSTRSAGMGFTGIGLPSATAINFMVPAAWSRIRNVRVEAGGLYEGIQSTETDRALYQARGLFNGSLLALPVSPANGIVVAGGVTPFSYSAYNISNTNTQRGIEYRINEIGSGGLTKAQIGLSYAPTADLAFGASFNYLFGEYSLERTFIPITANTSGATLVINEDHRGSNFTLSGMFNGFGKISEALQPLSVGFVATTQANLTFDLQNRLISDTQADTLTTAAKKLSIPFAFGVGVGYQVADRWIFAADYYHQSWTSARVDGNAFAGIRNSDRFGVGAEKLPLRDAGSWLDKLAYRFGFSYNALYYQIGGEPINEWAVTGGFTVPMYGDTRFSVGIEYAQRGVIKNSLVKDNIIRVSLSLSIAEAWFIRYEEE